MNFKWVAGLAVIALTGLMELLLNFNRWWYEPKLKPGQAPLPPGSLGWPIFGNMAAFLRAFKSKNPDSFISQYLVKYNHIGLYKAFLFWQPTILAATPEACKLVLSNNTLFETGWPSSTRKLIGRRSFAGVTGKEHLKLRRLTEPALNSPRALQQYVPRIVNNVRKCLQEWCNEEKVLFLTESRKFAFLTIHDILFSEVSGLRVDEISSLYYLVNQGIRALPINLPGTAYNKALKAHEKLVALVQKVIDERRSCKESKTDILALLMNEVDENGNPLADDQIIDLLVMYMNAGHDSTAHLILWLVIMLHKHPAVHDKVKAEQEEIVKNKAHGESLTLSDIRKMSYLSRVIDETLRLANISPMVFRKALADVEFNGFTIPKGWHIQAWLRQVHMDPKVHCDPRTFDPDRSIKYEARPFTLIPFGLGNRTCPGNELAKIEASILVHYLVTGYELKPLNPNCQLSFLPHPRPTDFYPVQVRRLATLSAPT